MNLRLPGLLSMRTQVVRLQDTISTSLPFVPQGSILGPLLFTKYVDELLSVPRNCTSMGYVDDTKTFITFSPCDLSKAVSDLNEDLNEISKWCCENSLLINPAKAKILVIGVSQLIRRLPSIPPIIILGKVVNPVLVARDLGVNIDCESAAVNSLELQNGGQRTINDQYRSIFIAVHLLKL